MKTLGLKIELGTISWAISENNHDGSGRIVKANILRFDNGVRTTKQGDEPMTKERTAARSQRKNIARRRLRKIAVLKVLSSNGFCPDVHSLLDQWRYRKTYPVLPEFMEWLSVDTSEDSHKNPYYFRFLCAHKTLDFSLQSDRYIFGRAIYHLSQRRGYASNSQSGNDDSSGVVQKSINEITAALEEAGCLTLGDYFYRKLVLKEKIRGCYASREEHYEREFDIICAKQNVSGKLKEELHRALFFQRPLKSQARNAGKCVFEKSKTRVQRSHPRFEEYRMLSLVNNIRIREKGYKNSRPLTDEEKNLVMPLFFRKKDYFDFVDIAKALAGKGRSYGTMSDDADLMFNFSPDQSVSGCPALAHIAALCGGNHLNWETALIDAYAKKFTPSGRMKDIEEVINDVWQILLTEQNQTKKKAWLQEAFPLASEKVVESASKASLDNERANLSLNVVRKMLPYLREGKRYDQAAFYSNIRKALPGVDENTIAEAKYAIQTTLNAIEEGTFGCNANKGELVKEAIAIYAGEQGFHPDLLYHPSAIKVYPDAPLDKSGLRLLGSPISSAYKNPVVARTLHQLRHLVNTLLKEGMIDNETRIRISCSTEVNSNNERKGILSWQNNREKQNRAYEAEIRKFYEETEGVSKRPTDNEILKYRLWEEQQHICLYTGKQIAISDFLGKNCRCDIEHTVPVSRRGDDSQVNKTLCFSSFNRVDKEAMLPCELPNFEEIKARLEHLGIKDKIFRYENDRKIKKSKARHVVEADIKAMLLQNATRSKMDYLYWKGKLGRFLMKEVPANFSFQQDALGRQARAMTVDFLKSAFSHVTPLSESTVESFRKEWKFPSEKDRSLTNRLDCIDACVVANIGFTARRDWENYYRAKDLSPRNEKKKPELNLPWNTFRDDVLATSSSLTVKYNAVNRITSGNKRKVRTNDGKIRRNAEGETIFQKSDRVSMPFVNSTFLGVIIKDGQKRTVLRHSLAGLKESALENVVDGGLKKAMVKAYAEKGAKAFSKGEFEYQGKKVKHVRLFERSRPENIVPLSRHRDVKKEYKGFAYVVNGANVIVARYTDGTGMIVSGYELAQAVKNKSKIVPKTNPETGAPLDWTLRRGQAVLFYESSPEEIDFSNQADLSRRLFRFSKAYMHGKYPRMFFVHSAESRRPINLDFKGKWNDVNNGVALQTLKIKCLVEGRDFYIKNSGIIKHSNL